MVPLFTRNRKIGVQSFILKVVNNSCPELKALIEGPRLDRRVNLTVVVAVVPVKNKRPCVEETFYAVTKEFSATGLAVVVDRPCGLDDAIVGFRFDGGMTFLRAKANHLNPLGGGFFQLGFRLLEMAHVGDYPELESASF